MRRLRRGGKTEEKSMDKMRRSKGKRKRKRRRAKKDEKMVDEED